MAIAIIAAGEFPRREYPRYLLGCADHVVCCDGALGAALRRSIRVDAVVGDMDSVSPSLLAKFSGKAVQETGQEDNDLSKAMRFVLEEWPGEREISIFGLGGKSEAHTLGNLALLMEFERRYRFWQRGLCVQAVSDYSTIFAVSGPATLDLGEGRRISIATDDPALRICSKGLRWPLDDVRLDSWWKATLNITSADTIELRPSTDSPYLIILD